MTNENFLSWYDVGRLVDKIVAQIYADNYRPKVIVGIPRGGLIPAVMLAHRLNIITVTSTSTNNESALVVDEICDTGKTFAKWKHPNLRFCALVNNLACNNIFKDVDYTGVEINKDEDKRWLVFPWEV